MFALFHIKTTFPKSVFPTTRPDIWDQAQIPSGWWREPSWLQPLQGCLRLGAAQTDLGSGADQAAYLLCDVEQVAQPL